MYSDNAVRIRMLIPILVTVLLAIGKTETPPDLSGDYFTTDMVAHSPYVHHIYNIRYNNEDKPDHCRNDICLYANTSTLKQGTFHWKPTTVGFRFFVRCPYDVTGGIYGYRDCIYGNETSGNWTVIWNEPFIEPCPEPPLRELLKTIMGQISENELRSDTWWQHTFISIMDTIRIYTEYPVFDDDIQDTFKLVESHLWFVLSRDQILDTATLDAMIGCLDWVVTLDTERYLLMYTQWPRLVDMFTIMTNMLVPPPGETLYGFQGNHVVIHVEVTDRIELEDRMFKGWSGDAMVANLSLHLSREGSKVCRILYMSELNLPQSFMITYKEYSMYTRTGFMSILGPLLFVSVRSFPEPSLPSNTSSTVRDDVTVVYSLGGVTTRARCGYAPSQDNYDLSKTWQTERCDGRLDDNGRLWCRCNVTGYVAAFYKRSMGLYIGVTSRKKDDDYFMSKSDIAVFMGFPASYELFVASHVMRALSLACLLLTMLSFSVFRKTRRGTPIKILMHLCSSLIVLLVSLYITEVIAGSRVGCRISNIMRYYLILVTLLWNAVEALNMYLMLVKVFNHDIHRFVIKAALVAWGFPVLMVSFVFAYSIKGFDGFYTDACQFRCQLRPTVLYYFFLLPMGLIIVFNLTVFCLVLRAILQTNNIPSSKVQRKDHCIRLVGALYTLVLFGVPWIFSAFGSIDATDAQFSLKATEGVFHVVFVVFVNLQGVFIFAFHCARNVEVREQWRSTLSRTYSTSGSRVSQSLDLPNATDKTRKSRASSSSSSRV